jgi:hypothetical protein
MIDKIDKIHDDKRTHRCRLQSLGNIFCRYRGA